MFGTWTFLSFTVEYKAIVCILVLEDVDVNVDVDVDVISKVLTKFKMWLEFV